MGTSLHTPGARGLAARLEHALFAITLAAIGYMYLGTLFAQTL